jgi:Flp pilus assembly protein TadD
MIHSTFSPAGMPAELLEKTFVQRERLAERLTELFVESALTDSKHHVLLVGPRGIGKSHLVSLIYHRLLDKSEVKDRLAIAYLREDEWGVTSFLDLLLRILREFKIPTRQLQSLTIEAAEERAWSALRESVQGKTLLVMLENLEAVLRSMGEEEQRKWRACLQNNPIWSLLATTPSLSEDISDHASPFYGFFEIQPLDGLSVSDAVTLVRRLAESQGRRDIAEYVCSPAGRARVRAVQHLANGNHRVFLIFYEFLARDKDADLVEPVLKTIDALTPYYQSQMKELSPQQRKLVEFLCRFRSAANVKTIASSCFVSHQTAASQLKQLLESRYLRVTRIGRESYYELNEPLLRICVETKIHDGKPIRLLVEFLRYWFARQEVTQRLASVTAGCPQREYLQAAIREYDNAEAHVHLSPKVSRLCVALSRAEVSGNKSALALTARELAEVSKIAEDWIHYSRALSHLDAGEEALTCMLQAATKCPNDPDLLHALSRAYDMAGQPENSLRTIEEVIRLQPTNGSAWIDKGQVLEGLRRNEDAFQAFSQAARLSPDWPQPTCMMGAALLKLGKYAEAERVLKPILKFGTRFVGIYVDYGCALANVGDLALALPWFEKATKIFPNHAEGWLLKGWTLQDLGRTREALRALERAMKLDPKDDRVTYHYCAVLFALGEHKRSLRELPVAVVAHQIFHELLELSNKEPNQRQLHAELTKLRSLFFEEPGPEALAGGLTEFMSAMHRQAEPGELPELRVWSTAIADVFEDQPRFAIIRKVFDVMVRYKESQDARVLLELPLEQRQLLESKEAGAAQDSVREPQTSSQ